MAWPFGPRQRPDGRDRDADLEFSPPASPAPGSPEFVNAVVTRANELFHAKVPGTDEIVGEEHDLFYDAIILFMDKYAAGHQFNNFAHAVKWIFRVYKNKGQWLDPKELPQGGSDEVDADAANLGLTRVAGGYPSDWSASVRLGPETTRQRPDPLAIIIEYACGAHPIAGYLTHDEWLAQGGVVVPDNGRLGLSALSADACRWVASAPRQPDGTVSHETYVQFEDWWGLPHGQDRAKTAYAKGKARIVTILYVVGALGPAHATESVAGLHKAIPLLQGHLSLMGQAAWSTLEFASHSAERTDAGGRVDAVRYSAALQANPGEEAHVSLALARFDRLREGGKLAPRPPLSSTASVRRLHEIEAQLAQLVGRSDPDCVLVPCPEHPASRTSGGHHAHRSEVEHV